LTASDESRVPATRASDRDRDAVVQRVQDAFAEGRLDDAEFDERMRAALNARTYGELDVLLTDLPAAAPAVVAPAALSKPGSSPRGGPAPGKLAVAYKGSVRRSGRWRVPGRYRTVVYKGTGVLDLRVAELTEQVSVIRAIAYKSKITVLVPPGVRAEITGFGVDQNAADDDPGYPLPADAPVIHVRAFAYKGTVELTTRPMG
jgi:hypothetical protein